MKAADLAVLPDRVMLDTNVLLAATDADRRGHGDALAVVNTWPRRGAALCLSGQILREYLAVATRDVQQNGLGMKMPEAVSNVRAFRSRMVLLDEGATVTDRLLLLLENVECTGKQTHDANVVAAMLVHDVATVVTADVRGFRRFSPFVTVLELG